MATKIRLRDGAHEDDVMAVIEAQAAELDYVVERDGPGRATAHHGRKPEGGWEAGTRTGLAIQIADGAVAISVGNFGSAHAGFARIPFFMVRHNRRAAAFGRAARSALRDAELA